MSRAVYDLTQLEIEQKLKNTVFLPQICYFCNEEITKKHGRDSDSLLFHSLDGDHENWTPSNKVPSHWGCHTSFHCKGRSAPWCKGDRSPMKRPEQRKRQSDRWTGDGNPMNNPESRVKSIAKIRKTKLERYGPSGVKNPEARCKAISEGKTKTRRERYGPSTPYKNTSAPGRCHS